MKKSIVYQTMMILIKRPMRMRLLRSNLRNTDSKVKFKTMRKFEIYVKLLGSLAFKLIKPKIMSKV
jgi:hypothetical protein